MSIVPKDPLKRRQFAKMVKLILVMVTISFVGMVIYMVVGFSEVDKRKYVYKSSVNNYYLKKIILKHAKIKFESSGSPESEKEVREAEKEFSEAELLKEKALNAMKEMKLIYEIRDIDNKVAEKYVSDQ